MGCALHRYHSKLPCIFTSRGVIEGIVITEPHEPNIGGYHVALILVKERKGGIVGHPGAW